MVRITLFLVFALFSIGAASAQQACLCTAGCTISSGDSYPAGAGQPTTCTVYRAGAVVAVAPVVLSSAIPVSNAARCTPASAPFVPGPAGSVSCSVPIPGVAAGVTTTVMLTATNAAGETPQSTGLTFQSVAVLPVLSTTPTNVRVQ